MMAPRWVTAVAIGLLSVSVAACPPKVPPALVTTAPSDGQVADVRRIAAKVIDSIDMGLQLTNDTGKLIDSLPLASSTKDKYDCAVLRVIGVDAPSPTVTTVCGTLPTLEAAPLSAAKRKLRAVTVCPSLRATVSEVLDVMNPLIFQLGSDGNGSLAFASSALRSAFGYARTFLLGGGSCSSPSN